MQMNVQEDIGQTPLSTSYDLHLNCKTYQLQRPIGLDYKLTFIRFDFNQGFMPKD